MLDLGNHQDSLEFGFPHTALDPFCIACHSWISWISYKCRKGEGEKSQPSAGSPTFHKLNEGSKVEVSRTKMSHILTVSESENRRSELTDERYDMTHLTHAAAGFHR